MTRISRLALVRSVGRLRRRLRRNPVAKALRLDARRFAPKIIPSNRLYRRHTKHRKGPFAPANHGWA